jgi:anti-sigma regulatory factor (Ser/Thr protein kinase)
MPAHQTAQVTVTSRRYLGVPASVTAARRLVREVLDGSPRWDDAELIAAELMTNAIRHTPSGCPGGTFTITIRHSSRWARLEVTDLGVGQWLAPPSDGTAEYGRGLVIVDMLAENFGRDVGDGGMPTVWAEITW